MYLSSVFLTLTTYVYFNVLFHAICVGSEETEEIDDCRFSSEARNGSFSIPLEKNCDVYVYTIDCSKTSSIISISTEADNAKDSSGDKSILVTFKENNTLDTGAKYLVEISQWTITPQNAKDGQFYFSLTSQLQMDITAKGNWSRILLKFVSDEVEFNGYDKSSEDAFGEVKPWESIKGRDYRPNSVFLFRINGKDVNSIDVVLKNLDIDQAVGEYLLIGSGTGPFEGPPPLFISNDPQEKKYKIFNKNAYIVFVTSATRSNHTGFKITWNGTKAPDEDANEYLRRDDILQSVQVCIYNKSAALAEFNKTDPFLKFRKEISEIASMYAKENNLITEYTNITSSQVEIFRVSDVIREDETDENMRAGGFYVMMKIRGPERGSAVFRWNELEQIIHKYYNGNHSSEINEYKISRCPTSRAPNKWTNIGFYAIIPVMCCLLLVIWAFRQSRFTDLFSKKIKGAALQLKTSQSAADFHAENVYETTVPKVRVTNDQGRRYTLTFNDTAAKSADEDSEVEIYNRDHFKRPSHMHETGSARNKRQGPFQQGETNAAFVEDEEGSGGTLQQTSPVPDTQPNETEHFYDTVKSEKGSGKGSVEDETKL